MYTQSSCMTMRISWYEYSFQLPVKIIVNNGRFDVHQAASLHDIQGVENYVSLHHRRILQLESGGDRHLFSVHTPFNIRFLRVDYWVTNWILQTVEAVKFLTELGRVFRAIWSSVSEWAINTAPSGLALGHSGPLVQHWLTSDSLHG